MRFFNIFYQRSQDIERVRGSIAKMPHQDAGEDQHRKELLSFSAYRSGGHRVLRRFLADLKSRGLLGKNLKLIITDGNAGILKALKGIYPVIKGQRCITRAHSNSFSMVNSPRCFMALSSSALRGPPFRALRAASMPARAASRHFSSR